MRGIPRLAGLLSILVGMAGCSSSSTAGPDQGTVEVRLTDAPSDDFQSATIFVSSVYLKGGDAGANEVLVSDIKTSYDLLTLQNGITATLASASVAQGSYSQLRLVVDSARVVLKPGHTFADGSTTASLRVPSGSESGLKVNFSGPVMVSSGTATIVIDFSVTGSFVLQGPSTQPTGVTFRPVLHAVDLGLAASISGTVTPAGAAAVVYAVAGTDTVQTAYPDGTGAFTLRFLPPGTYVAAAAAAGFQAAVSLPLELAGGQNMTGVNLVLVAIP